MIYRWSEAETYILMSVLTTLTETHGTLRITGLETRGISAYCCRWCISRKILWRQYIAQYFGIPKLPVKFFLIKEHFWQTQMAWSSLIIQWQSHWICSHVIEGRIWTKCIHNFCLLKILLFFITKIWWWLGYLFHYIYSSHLNVCKNIVSSISVVLQWSFHSIITSDK